MPAACRIVITMTHFAWTAALIATVAMLASAATLLMLVLVLPSALD
jgi:hypothetical protein